MSSIQQLQPPLAVPGARRGRRDRGLECHEHPRCFGGVSQLHVRITRQGEGERIFAGIHRRVGEGDGVRVAVLRERETCECQEDPWIVGDDGACILQVPARLIVVSRGKRQFAESQVVPGDLLGRCAGVTVREIPRLEETSARLQRIAAQGGPARDTREDGSIGSRAIELREDGVGFRVAAEFQVDLSEQGARSRSERIERQQRFCIGPSLEELVLSDERQGQRMPCLAVVRGAIGERVTRFRFGQREVGGRAPLRARCRYSAARCRWSSAPLGSRAACR